ncbi:hypothetical protein L1987_74625 [Smallanthus sonchifolius]|uniref:Uncharacterized protein n=1 Tax=Smallanthus sonchifolius TaxID=185202 RepID=A0ACB9A3A4_9ASTR|nr:hypothetical protein L1987_74625 [Smallanthus sonchifolius]
MEKGRYEYTNFFNEATGIAGVVLCDKTTSPQPTGFQKTTKRLLLDLQIVAPRTTNFYAASTRKIVVSNATVYAIAQCTLNISQSVCLKCLKLRSESLYDCLPTISGRAMDSGCFMRYDMTPFFGQNQITNIKSLLWDGDSSTMRYIIGLVVGGVSFLFLVLAFFSCHHRWKKTGGEQQGKHKITSYRIDMYQAPKLKGVVYYNYKHMELATNNFSEENMIGKGGFGEAILDEKNVVAVKKLKGEYVGAKEGFENEILLISQIRHRNILSLLGWSSGGSTLLLVLEYIRNGSLDQGYTAPEYVLYGHLSDKVDTFSFGIVIMEIVSGRKCTYRNFDESSTDCLMEYAWKLYETKSLMKLVDVTMDANQYKEEHVMNIIEIALLCTQSPVSKRPTMSEDLKSTGFMKFPNCQQNMGAATRKKRTDDQRDEMENGISVVEIWLFLEDIGASGAHEDASRGALQSSGKAPGFMKFPNCQQNMGAATRKKRTDDQRDEMENGISVEEIWLFLEDIGASGAHEDASRGALQSSGKAPGFMKFPNCQQNMGAATRKKRTDDQRDEMENGISVEEIWLFLEDIGASGAHEDASRGALQSSGKAPGFMKFPNCQQNMGAATRKKRTDDQRDEMENGISVEEIWLFLEDIGASGAHEDASRGALQSSGKAPGFMKFPNCQQNMGAATQKKRTDDQRDEMENGISVEEIWLFLEDIGASGAHEDASRGALQSSGKAPGFMKFPNCQQNMGAATRKKRTDDQRDEMENGISVEEIWLFLEDIGASGAHEDASRGALQSSGKAPGFMKFPNCQQNMGAATRKKRTDDQRDEMENGISVEEIWLFLEDIGASGAHEDASRGALQSSGKAPGFMKFPNCQQNMGAATQKKRTDDQRDEMENGISVEEIW